jgi:tetratricopeptide (TPR) repeat protein
VAQEALMLALLPASWIPGLLAVRPGHVVGLGLLLLVTVVLWHTFGSQPRRRRGYRRAMRRLHDGDWRSPLSWAQRQSASHPSALWQGRCRSLEGECHRLAGETLLAEKDYEKALDHHLAAARLLGLPEAEVRDRVREAMLAEVRRLFAGSTGPDVSATLDLIDRALRLAAPGPEAAFWQGLCHIRQGRSDLALAALHTAHAAAPFLDPPLYLGALLLREGRPQEALRHLSEANRLAPGCPFVSWQLGTAMVAANSDSQLAVRALQRAVGPQGFGPWLKTPRQAWTEGLPEGRSFVRRLASEYPYACPLLGDNVGLMIRQAQLVLAQAQGRLGNYQEAADLYAALMQDAPPTVGLSRGLGQALARLGKYEDAIKHLRSAYDREEPRNPLTAGYLALCSARGKPARPEDRLQNLAWAIRLVAQFHRPGDREWAGLCSEVFAEARAAGVPLGVDDQRRLCDTLASVDATDPLAAAAYEQLTATYPDAVRPEYAWLHGQGVVRHGGGGERELELLARAFQDPSAGRAFFAARQWDHEELEYALLARTAVRRPGRFPEVLGPDYAGRGESLLLARSMRLEAAGDRDAALAAAEILVELAPDSRPGLDRLACLAYRRGNLDRAAALLGRLQHLAPGDPLPFVRRAMVERALGIAPAWVETMELALAQCRGRRRAAVAFLGARLALASGLTDQAVPWLHACLQEEPEHADALWCLAAVKALRNDNAGLAAQAAAMQRPDVAAPRFHYLAAVCHLAAGDQAGTHAALARTTADPALASDCDYLGGCAFAEAGNGAAAREALAKAAQATDGSSADHARARLGRICFSQGEYAEAIRSWTGLERGKRAAWQFEEALQQTVLLCGLHALQGGEFPRAAEWFDQARRLGGRDLRLGAWHVLSLVKEGQRWLREARSTADVDQQALVEAVRSFEAAVEAGCRDPQILYLLATAQKWQGKLREARKALALVADPDADVWFQRGLLSLRERQWAQAEQELSQAVRLEPRWYEAAYNLLRTELTLGRTDAAAGLASQVAGLTPSAENRTLFQALHALLLGGRGANGSRQADPVLARLAAEDEQRLVRMLGSVGHLETACDLLHALAGMRPRGAEARQAYLEAMIVRAKTLLDRTDWGAAEKLLLGLDPDRLADRGTQAAFYNLLGVCSCLNQNFREGAQFFQHALKRGGHDPRVRQNLALVQEWLGSLVEADPHWEQYFGLFDPRLPTGPGVANYRERLRYEGRLRLAARNADRQRWDAALLHARQALELRPNDPVTLERVLQWYHQAGRPEEARRLLRQLRAVQPNDPLHELIELELQPFRNLDDVEKALAGLQYLAARPCPPRVEERAAAFAAGLVPVLLRMTGQVEEQLERVLRQIRPVPQDQVNWPTVHAAMRSMKQDLKQARKLAALFLLLVRNPELQRRLRELTGRLEQKIDQCKKVGG